MYISAGCKRNAEEAAINTVRIGYDGFVVHYVRKKTERSRKEERKKKRA